VLRDGTRRPRSRPRLRRARHHPRLRAARKLGFHDWDFDYVLLDFLGDVVCGGFGLPIARDMCQKVIVVGSNDLQSLYVANNVCSAVEYFRKLGGNVGVAGMVINKDDGTGEAQAFRRGRRHSGPGSDSGGRRHSPQERQLRDHRQGRAARGAPCSKNSRNVAEAPPLLPSPEQDELLGCSVATKPGRDVVLEPATLEDMCGEVAEKPSLEVIYDEP
jgi:chlorophyllide a reductase subunit X